MTLPDELVTAVAAELHGIFGGKVGYCHHETSVLFTDGTTGPYRRCEQDALRLVAAVLRALRESERARNAIHDAVQNVGNSWLAADNALAAIAKLADDA